MRGDTRHVPSRPADTGRLTRVLGPVISAAGFDLESLRVSTAGRRRVLRVVVDADGGPGLDDIAVLSRSLSAALDSSGVMGEDAYTLEVSSPGVDRPLTEPRHWRRARGRLVRVPVLAAGGPGAVTGRILDVRADGVTLDIDGRPHEFGYRELGAGQVQVEFGGAAGPGAAAGPGDEGEPDGH